ncbi:MAG: VCBS repeat-containing protein [Desulfobacteraceae bacterium]|nr:VCBS repeat-containing protein [Desulfobacteraceae bacterium]
MKVRKTPILLTVLLFLFCLAAPALAEKTRIIVKPFSIEADQEYPFLKKGVFKMLLSRLEIPGICSPVLENDPEASLANYVLTGTILIFGDGISTDAKLTDTTTGAAALSFNRFGKTKGDVLAHVDLLAREIKTEILGVGPKPKTVVQQPIQQQQQQQPQAQVRQPQGKAQLWRSPALKNKIISLAISDINGDSKNETVVCSQKSVQVFLRENRTLKRLAEFDLNPTDRVISIDAGDINANGRSEIYVSCVDKRTNLPSSFIMEWNGSEFTKIAARQPWLFRIIETTTRGTLLLGQDVNGKKNQLRSPVYRITWQKTGLVETELKLPKGLSLYSFTFGDPRNTGEELLVALTRDGRIKLFTPEGDEVWRSNADFGGTTAFVEYKGNRYNKDDGYQMSRLFLQQRIHVADLDNDGKNSVLVVKNVDTSSGLLAKTRYFSKGHVKSLRWDEMGLTPEGRTRSFPGYISDYVLADQNNDGKKELVYSISRSDGVVDQKHTTRLYSQDRLSISYNEAF